MLFCHLLQSFSIVNRILGGHGLICCWCSRFTNIPLHECIVLEVGYVREGNPNIKLSETELKTLFRFATAVVSAGLKFKQDRKRINDSKGDSVHMLEDKEDDYGTRKRGNCYRCGFEGHFARDPECNEARSVTCQKCKKTGFLKKFCRTKVEDKTKKGNVVMSPRTTTLHLQFN